MLRLRGKLQERYSALSPIYNGGLTNHIPMMITALRLLDVDNTTIVTIVESYLHKKYIVDLSSSGIDGDPFNEEYIRLTNYFMNEMEDKKPEDVIQLILEGNKYSLHSGLFHGLIRLAYAYLEGSELLIAQALAYFTLIAEELKLPVVKKENLSQSFKDLVQVRKTVTTTKTRTMDKMNELLNVEEIKNGLFVPYNLVEHKEEALELFVEYFNKTSDFYILHVITGYHALHVLSQFFTNFDEVLDNFFMQALLIMLIYPHKQYDHLVVEEMSFAALAKRVPELSDEHDIKLFCSLAYFYERYEMDSLRTAANLIFN